MLVSDQYTANKNDQMSINSPSAEVLTVDIKTGNEQFTMVGVYRPPQSSILSFKDSFCDILRANKKDNTILAEDFNIDTINYFLSPVEDNFLDELKSLSFLPLISIPTRVTESTATCIDHIYFNSFTYAL